MAQLRAMHSPPVGREDRAHARRQTADGRRQTHARLMIAAMAIEQDTFFWDTRMKKLADDELQVVSFHNHLVARCHIKN